LSVDVSDPNATTDSSTETPGPFPLDLWSIPTYLATTNTSCTSNPSTWRCYPYTTYSPSTPSSSFSMLLWRITSRTNSTLDLQISNTDTVFSYPFTNQPLQLANINDETLSAFAFNFTYRKQVVPTVDITGDNVATRCYYNNTLLSVRLYGAVPGASGPGAVVDSPVGSGNTTREWPYAIDYEEVIGAGPECFRYFDGVQGERVDVPPGGEVGDCSCEYRNYGLS